MPIRIEMPPAGRISFTVPDFVTETVAGVASG
jgi:hypothetical protein